MNYRNSSYRKNAEKDRCIQCGIEPPAPRRKRCQRCLEDARSKANTRRDELRSQGLCPQCGTRRVFLDFPSCGRCAFGAEFWGKIVAATKTPIPPYLRKVKMIRAAWPKGTLSAKSQANLDTDDVATPQVLERLLRILDQLAPRYHRGSNPWKRLRKAVEESEKRAKEEDGISF